MRGERLLNLLQFILSCFKLLLIECNSRARATQAVEVACLLPGRSNLTTRFWTYRLCYCTHWLCQFRSMLLIDDVSFKGRPKFMDKVIIYIENDWTICHAVSCFCNSKENHAPVLEYSKLYCSMIIWQI